MDAAMVSLDLDRLVPLMGRIAVAGGEEHPCRAWIADPDAATVVTLAEGRAGQSVLCRVATIGMLTGTIHRTTGNGSRLAPALSDRRRTRVASRLAWHMGMDRHQGERRNAERIVPNQRHIVVRLPSGANVSGEIRDLSMTGAMITLPKQSPVEIGVIIVVGKRFARVVRIEDARVAVEFRLPFSAETFNADV